MVKALFVAGLLSLAVVASVTAGPLASYQPGVLGDVYFYSTSFDEGDLHGTIDSAVYNAGYAPAGFSGFTPDPGDLLYVYQLNVTGPASGFDFLVDYPFGSIGAFTATGVTGQAPLSALVGDPTPPIIPSPHGSKLSGRS